MVLVGPLRELDATSSGVTHRQFITSAVSAMIVRKRRQQKSAEVTRDLKGGVASMLTSFVISKPTVAAASQFPPEISHTYSQTASVTTCPWRFQL